MSSVIARPLVDDGKAPSYNVPLKHVVSIEHPCIVKNFDHAYKSLGGEHQLRHLLTPSNQDGGTTASVAVSLRPNDPLAKRISSTPLSTQNVLVKITVPKRTGRKRKRGSEDPYEAGSMPAPVHSGVAVADLLQTMRDNPENYVVEPIGMVNETHRFETIPDFQTRASEVPVLREIRAHAMKPKYDSFKDFRIDYRFGTDQNVTYPDPPSYIPTAQTFDWQYDQRPDDSGTRGKQYRGRPKLLPPSLQSVSLSSDTLDVPQAPPPDSVEQTSSRILKAIDAVRELLETRPIVTMRALDAILETTTMKAISWAVRYLGYYVTNGPWQGAVVKYGVDPRSDPQYRIYQTLNFTLGHNREINSALGKQGHANVVNSHIFDGKTLFGVGRNWQLCDLTDPMIQNLINSPEAIRHDCDTEQHGWLYNGIIAKVRVIMREKLVRIINGASLPPADYFGVLWQLPNQIDNPANCAVGDECTPEARQLARDVAKEALKGPPKTYEVLQRAADGGALPRTGSMIEGEDDEGSDEEDVDGLDASLNLNEDDDEDDEEEEGEEEDPDVVENEEEDDDELENEDEGDGAGEDDGEDDSNDEEEDEGVDEDEDEEDAFDEAGFAVETDTNANWQAVDEG